jgi:cytolysin (calcineurin-like family phosphatase)
MENLQTNQAAPHVDNLRKELRALVEHLRRDSEKVTDPQAAALFETSAEVIGALERAFNDYREGKERAWRKPNQTRD